MSATAAIFVDRDGVLNELVEDEVSQKPESPYRASDVRLMPRAVEGLRALATLGLPIVVVSNQPAAAKGTTTLARLLDVHAEVERQLSAAGVHLDAHRYCFHHPDGVDPELGVLCNCRKPAPGMLLDAARELRLPDLSTSWLIGDSDVDVLAGRAVGCRTILVEEPASQHRRGGVEPDARAADLYEAARVVLAAVAPRRVPA